MLLSSLRQKVIKAAHEASSRALLTPILGLSALIAVIGWWQSSETIVLVPPLLEERAAVSASYASPSYKKAWALSVSLLAGNVTPGNADLVLRSLGDLLAPTAYRKMSESLAAQIADIKRDSLTVSFEPRQILDDPNTGRVFVTGSFQSQGVSGDPIKSIRTFQMQIEIRFGRPWITEFTPYAGMPLTENSAAALKAKAEGRDNGARP